MPLRVNTKDLSALGDSGQSSDKEGVLFIREKQDGLFKKAEFFTERWFKLKGNILFYMKTNNRYSETFGALVLERFAVQLDPEETKPNAFIISFECAQEPSVYLFARTEGERDAWVSALHAASCECLQLQLDFLREELQRVKKHVWKEGVASGRGRPVSELSHMEGHLEMAISCQGLGEGTGGTPPSPCVIVHAHAQNAYGWQRVAQTETLDETRDPEFVSIVNINLDGGDWFKTKLKLTVFDVQERVTNIVGLFCWMRDEVKRRMEERTTPFLTNLRIISSDIYKCFLLQKASNGNQRYVS